METSASETALAESARLGVCNVLRDPGMKGLSRKSNTVFFDIILIAFTIAISFSP